MSQGRYVDGELVQTVFVVNQVSGGGGGGGLNSGEVSGIVSGIVDSGFTTTGSITVNDITVTGTITFDGGEVSGNLIPDTSGAYDLGSTARPWKDGYFTSGTIYVGSTELKSDGSHLLVGTGVVLDSGEVEVQITGTPHDQYTFRDTQTEASVTLGVRDGTIIVTNPFNESVSSVDLGATTIDPGKIVNVSLNGSGKYTVGPSTLLNMNGFITLEYINAPGQFFVIEDVDGGNFGPGDRQLYGLVRETLADGTDLSGGVGPLTTGTNGGWSHTYGWFYTGGYPYGWSQTSLQPQTPQGSGISATGTFAGQTTNRRWWELCQLAGTGKKMRWGIAQGTLSDATGADFSNRLIAQLYVTQSMIDYCNNNPSYSDYLPAVVKTTGPGWYTQSATVADYENMGQFPDGNDKGYRWRWSTGGNTTLNQLPYVTGQGSNTLITAATGNSHYVVYAAGATDLAAANAVLRSGTVTGNNRFYGQGVTVHLLQYNNPYTFVDTPSPDENAWLLPANYVGAVEASPLFTSYSISTADEITTSAISVAPLQKIHAIVCKEVLEAVTAYYLIRNFDTTNTTEAQTLWASALQAALAGQIRNTYDAVNVMQGDTTGTGGTNLFPEALKNATLDTLREWMKKTPDN